MSQGAKPRDPAELPDAPGWWHWRKPHQQKQWRIEVTRLPPGLHYRIEGTAKWFSVAYLEGQGFFVWAGNA